MSVYIDNFYETSAGQYGRMKMSHMIADNKKELLMMVDKIGVNRKWIQKEGTTHEHFDVCIAKRAQAIKMGAIPISFMELGRKLNMRHA
jgi:hypothetical protein